MFVFLMMVILTGVIWNLELWILLPPPPKCWNYRYVALHPVYVMLGTGGRASCMRASTFLTELHPHRIFYYRIVSQRLACLTHNFQPFCSVLWTQVVLRAGIQEASMLSFFLSVHTHIWVFHSPLPPIFLSVAAYLPMGTVMV